MDPTHDDLTDSYRDESILSCQSTPRTRHPKGDTPLPAHAEASRSHSRSRSSSSSIDESTAAASSPKAAGKEDLDRLMALLDGDEAPIPSSSTFTAAQGSNTDRLEPRKLADDSKREATRQPSSPATPQQALEDLTLLQGTPNHSEPFPIRAVPSTSTPPPATAHSSTHPATHDRFPSTSSTTTSEVGSVSPSVRARSTSLRAQSAQSVHSTRHIANTMDSVEQEASESTMLPAAVLQGQRHDQQGADTTVGKDMIFDQRNQLAPRSKSVLEEVGWSGRRGEEAARSRHSLGTTPPPRLANGPSTTTTMKTTIRATSPPPRQDHSMYLDDRTARVDPWRSDGDLTFHAPGSSRNRANHDQMDNSDARIADEALSEFDSIIHNATPHRNRARPPSRLRQDPSPWLSPHVAGRGQDITEQAEDYTQTTAQFTAQGDQGYGTSVARTKIGRATEDERSMLISELREANEYISLLQDDIENISRIVSELKADRTREQARLEEFRRAQLPLSAQEQAELAVARHLISLLPSFVAATPPSRSRLPTSVNSLALAVAFTRSIDSLVQHGPQGENRRDEVVFTQDNVEKMLKRVKKWERVVRSQA
ncbi:BQ2448_6317 [Microbotryum intermedium]|uniref:BQ2448_6317 protein n=1 Tax=Microbotryum intermedium TaxID=269621 RepID=A0A238FKW0_9BASI|nr:BQ2448_6317 [Microbotryum intermedium]